MSSSPYTVTDMTTLYRCYPEPQTVTTVRLVGLLVRNYSWLLNKLLVFLPQTLILEQRLPTHTGDWRVSKGSRWLMSLCIWLYCCVFFFSWLFTVQWNVLKLRRWNPQTQHTSSGGELCLYLGNRNLIYILNLIIIFLFLVLSYNSEFLPFSFYGLDSGNLVYCLCYWYCTTVLILYHSTDTEQFGFSG